ncbi:MAG: 16S rRNA (uracil(1498)-N(3))-methyltransferase [Micavibrio aeruginosavorus]|uniref:Ribosomal RNA small subunit methyltransferase E n=1 Tax=Micavibrio aeruginosavorus TaxID=349221 RepID=A0A2W5FMD2_9BACT|nr:MAG: 16S rRNA (uracil(1498)-N(3))-methyltransferase [Micavibrio aeruginosavorus]
MGKEQFDYRSPRIFVESGLAENSIISLDDDTTHYLKNVLRRPDGAPLRVFNGRDGEFMALFAPQSKKVYVLEVQNRIREQAQNLREIHLIFCPIKKDRQDFLIEKAVELGATHFHPVLTQQTVIRDLNETRIKKQIQEAAEQCERLDIPKLEPLVKLDQLLRSWNETIPLYAAVERSDTNPITSSSSSCAILIGPEGGFSDDEKNTLLDHPKVTAVTLCERILRAETAALFSLSILASG